LGFVCELIQTHDTPKALNNETPVTHIISCRILYLTHLKNVFKINNDIIKSNSTFLKQHQNEETFLRETQTNSYKA